jgi:hypothetical protein
VRVSRWVWLFLICAGALAVQLMLRRELFPFAGTLATAALLGLAMPGAGTGSHSPVSAGANGAWPCRAAIGGLVALTLAAGAVDFDAGGFGWPVAVGEHAGIAAVALLTAAVSLLAVAVLGAAAPDLRLRRLWPAAVAGLAVAVGFAAYVNTAEPDSTGKGAALPVVALLLVLVAANAAFAAGRRLRLAGAGLLAVLALAVGAVSAAVELGAPDRPFDCDRDPVCAEALRQVNTGPLPPAAGEPVRGRAASVAIAVVSVTPADRSASSVGEWPSYLPALGGTLVLLGLGALVSALFPVQLRRFEQ